VQAMPDVCDDPVDVEHGQGHAFEGNGAGRSD
jgi:hypothetical protein